MSSTPFIGLRHTKTEWQVGSAGGSAVGGQMTRLPVVLAIAAAVCFKVRKPAHYPSAPNATELAQFDASRIEAPCSPSHRPPL